MATAKAPQAEPRMTATSVRAAQSGRMNGGARSFVESVMKDLCDFRWQWPVNAADPFGFRAGTGSAPDIVSAGCYVSSFLAASLG